MSLRDDPRKDQILRVLLEVRDVDHVHRSIGEAPPWQIARRAVVGHQPGAALSDVGQSISNLADRRDVVGAPALAVAWSPCASSTSRNHSSRSQTTAPRTGAREYRVAELATDDPFPE